MHNLPLNGHGSACDIVCGELRTQTASLQKHRNTPNPLSRVHVERVHTGADASEHAQIRKVAHAHSVPERVCCNENAGEVISTQECQRRMRAASEAGEPHFYMMELGPNQVIDARKKGNLARLINSSCEPNCVTQKWTDAATHEVRIGIFAMRNIEAGEELTYDYMFQHSSGAAAAALGYRSVLPLSCYECRKSLEDAFPM